MNLLRLLVRIAAVVFVVSIMRSIGLAARSFKAAALPLDSGYQLWLLLLGFAAVSPMALVSTYWMKPRSRVVVRQEIRGWL